MSTDEIKDAIESAPAPSSLVDYQITIQHLDARARGARKRVRWVGSILTTGVLLIASVIFIAVNPVSQTGLKAKYSNVFAEIYKVDTGTLLATRVSTIVRKLNGPSGAESVLKGPADASRKSPSAEEVQRLRVELKEALDDLDRAVKIEAQRQPDSISSKVASITSTLVFSMGAMVFLYLVIQIALMFIRYHTRLAELYDAQADALRAAGGNANLAYGFLQHFSPNSVELGATPTTLYEKMFDAMKEIAVKRA